ncbi:Rho GTPase-activating protein SYDE [Paragonimus westermani]|uniref:Rho GTPase-activating protein SYDE n=1 Tax=Paragonimus westermani TaxID=34504 RepID=A0A5J4NI25_9TREM|nr:Rho GTPase-activating protein SYDE [Paragonimus westermani]
MDNNVFDLLNGSINLSNIDNIYGLRTHLLEDYYAPHSIASTSTTQASVATTLHLREPGEAKCGLLPLHLDPVVGVESGQLEDPTDIKLEERFADFFVLPSERCVTTPYPTSSGQITSSEYEWNLPNPDNPGKVVQPRSEKLSGILVIDLVAGNGLSSSQVLLRDLYCVIEMDSIRKARSMIRTSTSYFEWNEVFELDMDENRFLAFLLYQWDPRTKHRLCFYGGIDLRNLVQRLAKIPQNCTVSSNLINQPPRQNFLLSPALSMIPTNFDKIALQLEPRGVLYLEFTHYPLDRVYHRYQPTVSTSLQHASISDDVLFGVPIDELIERERVIAQLMRTRYPASVTAVSSLTPEHVPYVPLFIRKCIEEIDRRGTDVVGIYRLTGSVWMKLQVRDLFNRITKSTLRAIFRGDRKAVEAIIEAVDLSAERVPDIHALTGKLC